jgi:short-subunit dehydrogenase
MQLHGRRALVTGASGGIGGAIVRRLQSEGVVPILTARREPMLRELARETGAEVVVADLSDPVSVMRLAEEAGEVDVLVANAGVDSAEDLTDLQPEHIERIVAVNLTAPAILAAQFAPEMRARGAGHIVFIASMAAKVATCGNGPMYTATKWGLRGLALSLRDALKASGVGVSAIFPGPISGAGMFASTGVKLPAAVRANTPEQVAGAVVTAIERNVAEIDVAAPPLRFGGLLSGVAPTFVSALARRQGADNVRRAMVAARRAARGES